MSSDLKVAIVHDYLHEFGGAERVLLALSEIWPKAPIYTAFYTKGSAAWKRFSNKDIRVSWFHYLPFASKLASPLRFLAPFVWKYFNPVKLDSGLTKYDVVVTSANWYITKGVVKGPKAIEVCYCHTPPRYLYGYKTSINWQKYWPVRVYGLIVGHFLRLYDFQAAQKVDFFVANSKNVARRIEKFYRRKAKVIYPPVEIKEIDDSALRLSGNSHISRSAQGDKRALKSLAHLSRKSGYYLVVSRVVGGKGLELAVEAASKLQVSLKVVGKPAGWGSTGKHLKKIAGEKVEFVGEVTDSELYELYAGAKAFLATAEDEDFGITPVEAMAAGTPVIAYNGGGYRESMVPGKTGVFFKDYDVQGLVEAIKEFEAKSTEYKDMEIKEHARKFSKERFKKEMKEFVTEALYSRG
jgi:glycosyltransferase involved in cell wall biosynthesis